MFTHFRAILLAVCSIGLFSHCGVRNTSNAVETGRVRPNVLLITVDALRADHLSCYGYARATSPHIDEVAQSGTRFDHAYAPRGLTWVTLATVHTSLHPVAHGVRDNGQRLPDEVTALAETLTEAGYTCAAVLTNASSQNWEGFAYRATPVALGDDAKATQLALAWLEHNRATPFFLWVHYSAPHSPYDPPAVHRDYPDAGYTGFMDGKGPALARATTGEHEMTPADMDQLMGLYDGEVRYSDAEIGRLLNHFDAKGLRQSTLVVITADHGEELFDHHRYFGHGASVYDSVLRVPLIIAPGSRPAAARSSSAIVQSVDIAPTILDLAGVPIPAQYQGNSLAPALNGSPLPPKPAFSEYADAIFTVRTSEYKLILNPSEYRPIMKYEAKHLGLKKKKRAAKKQAKKDPAGAAAEVVELPSMPIKRIELYRVADDPKETKDISASAPDALKDLLDVAAEVQHRFGWKFSQGDPERFEGELDPAVREELQALGYVL